jgi:hypothetical protein
MAISNVSSSNQSTSVNRGTSAPAIPPSPSKERVREKKDDDSTVVSLSTHARDLHRADADQPSPQEHIERIKALNRTDEMAQERIRADAQIEEKAVAAHRKDDEQAFKRINTYA